MGSTDIKQPKKQYNWPPRLPGIINSFKLKRGVPVMVHMQTKMKSSFEALSGEFAQENVLDKL